MHVTRGFIGIGGYKEGYLVKMWSFLIGKMYYKGFNKRILGGIDQYLMKIGIFFKIS
jgi:hypothetical protein